MAFAVMADASSAAAIAVADALTGMISSVGGSSLGRLVAGANASAHNLIEGVSSPTARSIAKSRGYQYRNNGANGAEPVLTSQQLQVTKTSTDQRIMRIQRDAVNLLIRASQTSDALHHQHPGFEDIGAAHLRLTLPVPTTTSIPGFAHRDADSGVRAGPPSLQGGMTEDASDHESVADSSSSGDTERSPNAYLSDSEAHPANPDPGPLRRTDSQSYPVEWRRSGGGKSDSSDSGSVYFEAHDATPTSPVLPLGALGNALQAREALRGKKKTGPDPRA